MKKIKTTETHAYDRALDELCVSLHIKLEEEEKKEIPPVLYQLEELTAGIRNGTIVICVKEIK